MLVHFIPGDPVDLILGDQANLEDKAQLRTNLGLDLPLGEQYLSFWAGLLKGDLGTSLRTRQPVTRLLWERFPATFELALTAVFLALLIGLPVGALAGAKPYTGIDVAGLGYGILGISLPAIFLAPLLIYVFSMQLDLLPVSERSDFSSLILPSLSLAIPLSAVILRISRASMLEVTAEDYIRTARAKGLSERKVYLIHALRNALIPVITIVGLQLGALLTGTVVTETIFDWPGIGTLLLGAIQQRDYPVIQGCVLFIALIYVSVNFVTDLAYGFANPRIRLEDS
jgi:peptide/nickel transport system permease protein